MSPKTKEIVLISDTRVFQIPVKENKEKLVDLSTCAAMFVDKRKEKDSQFFSRLREGVLARLLEAQRGLPNKIRLLVIEGYRPLSLQKEYFARYTHKLSKLHPNWDESRVYEEASKFVAPPEIVPPHSTGGAVDLTLATDKGVELDMGTHVNASPVESNNACFTYATNITPAAKENRELLIDAMSRNGFVNYKTEWWHWSYGDKYWAYSIRHPFALYGSIE